MSAVFSWLQHAPESKGQEVVEVKHTVRRTGKWTCDPQIQSAEYTVFPLGKAAEHAVFPRDKAVEEPIFFAFAAGVTRGIKGEGGSEGTSAAAGLNLMTAFSVNSFCKALQHLFIWKVEYSLKLEVFRLAVFSHSKSGEPPVNSFNRKEMLMIALQFHTKSKHFFIRDAMEQCSGILTG